MSHPDPQNTLAAGGVTLTDLHAANIARQAEWCPDQLPDLSFRGNELAGETGEACNVIKKLERERQGWRGSRATKEQLAEELADVVICADLCAVTAGIDLDAAVRDKFNATSEKVGLTTKLAAPAAKGGTEAMRAALAPFADAWRACMEIGDQGAGYVQDDQDAWVSGNKSGGAHPLFKFGDLHRAAEALASPPPPAGADTSLNAWELAEERKRADLFVAKLNEAEGYATRLAQSLSDKHFPNPDWRPLPDLYGVLTQIDNMTTGLARKEPPPAGAAGGGSGDLGALSAGESYEATEKYADECYELGKRDGFNEGVQAVACRVGHHGEYCVSPDPERHCPDAATMIDQIADLVSAPTPDLGAQGEPVAWIYEGPGLNGWQTQASTVRPSAAWASNIRPLYEAPAAPRSGSAVTVEEIAKAIDAVEVGYSINLKSLTAEGRVYTLDLGDGSELHEFSDSEDAREFALRHWSLVRAKAVLAHLEAPRPGETGDHSALLYRVRAAFNSDRIADKNIALRRAYDAIAALTGSAEKPWRDDAPSQPHSAQAEGGEP